MSDEQKEGVIELVASLPPTISRFYLSEAFIRGIMGPVGSGKSSGCVLEIGRRAAEMPPDKRGIRRSKWVVVRNCYSDDTEILTEQRGWVLFKDLEEQDRVASLVGDKLEFVNPTYYYSAPYTGDMIGFQNEGLDFLVTPDHKLSVSMRSQKRKPEWSDYIFRKASECYGKSHIRVKRNVENWEGAETGGSPDFFEWLGFWFAEGSAFFRPYNGSVRHGCFIITKN